MYFQHSFMHPSSKIIVAVFMHLSVHPCMYPSIQTTLDAHPFTGSDFCILSCHHVLLWDVTLHLHHGQPNAILKDETMVLCNKFIFTNPAMLLPTHDSTSSETNLTSLGQLSPKLLLLSMRFIPKEICRSSWRIISLAKYANFILHMVLRRRT